MGHCKLKHIQKMLLSSCLNSGLSFFVMGLVLNSGQLYADFGFDQNHLHIGLILFGMLYAPVSLITGTLGNVLSRKYEFEADAYSATTYQQPEAMISALKKLSVDTLSNLTPHPLRVFLDYSHPPVLERIRAIRKLAGKSSRGNLS